MTSVWVAVVKASVDKARVAHFRPALWRLCRQCPRCSGVEKRSWIPKRLAACTWGNTQMRRATLPVPQSKKRSGAHCAGGKGHSPLTCGGEQESDAE